MLPTCVEPGAPWKFVWQVEHQAPYALFVWSGSSNWMSFWLKSCTLFVTSADIVGLMTATSLVFVAADALATTSNVTFLPVKLIGFAAPSTSAERFMRLRYWVLLPCCAWHMVHSSPSVPARLVGALESTDPDREIIMYINSPGGSFASMTAIYDTMQFVRPHIQTV